MPRTSGPSNKSPAPFKACNACRESRAKCDKQQPCQRCTRHCCECIREHRQFESKTDLRQEKSRLQSRLKASTQLFHHLAVGSHSEEILQALRRNESVEKIAQSLREAPEDPPSGPSRAHTYRARRDGTLNSSQGLPSPPLMEATADSSTVSNAHKPQAQEGQAAGSWPQALANTNKFLPPSPKIIMNLPQIDASLPRTPLEPLPVSTIESPQSGSEGRSVMDFDLSPTCEPASTAATSIPSELSPEANDYVLPDKEAVPIAECPKTDEHMNSHANFITIPPQLVLDLTDSFFSWLDVPFPVVSRVLFVGDYTEGRTEHCSAALVRAISCLGCRALGGYDSQLSTYASLGNHLFEEAKILLSESSASTCLPDVQAFSLLALHQLSNQQFAEARQLAEAGVKRLAALFDEDYKPEVDSTASAKSYAQTAVLLNSVTIARFVRIMSGHALGCNLQTSADGVDSVSSDANLEYLLSLPGLLQANPTLEAEHHHAFLFCQLMDSIYRFEQQRYMLDLQTSINLSGRRYQESLLWYQGMLEDTSGTNGYCPLLHIMHHFNLLALFRPFCHMSSVCGVCPAIVGAESSAAIVSLAEAASSPRGFSLTRGLAPLFSLVANTLHEPLCKSTMPDVIIANGWEAGSASLGQGYNP